MVTGGRGKAFARIPYPNPPIIFHRPDTWRDKTWSNQSSHTNERVNNNILEN